MSARIRFRGGPLAGKVFEFDDEKDLIVVGRDPERSDVVLPEDLTMVGREHLALKRSVGRYRLRLGGDHAVFLDGRLAIHDQELPEVASLRLGEKGPEMIVQTLGTTAIAPTIDDGVKPTDVPTLLVETVNRTAVNRRILALTAVLLAGLTGIGVWAFRDAGKKVARVTEEQAKVRGMLEEEAAVRERVATEQSEATSRLKTEMATLDDDLERLKPDVSGLRSALAGLGPRMQGVEERIQRLTPRLRERLQSAAASVYVVVMRRGDGKEDAVGTAWVASPDQVVTNAHVVDLFETIRKAPGFEGTEFFLRSAGKSPRDHAITSMKTHPGWRVFGELWDAYRPTDVTITGNLSPLRTSGACDVALLEVEDAEHLGAPLAIADDAALAALGAGDVVGFVGYPAEDMVVGGVNLSHPSPTTQVAHVTAVTNFFLATDDPAYTTLVQHALPATGGASGSPIFNDQGEVVAVLNAGNITVGGMGQRIPSAVLVNFAQRADLVRELLDGTAPTRQEARTKRWQEGIQTFTSFRSAVEANALEFLDRYLEEVTTKEGRPPERILDVSDVLGSSQPNPPPATANDLPVAIPVPGTYVFFAYAPMGLGVGLAVRDAANPTSVIGQDRPDHWHAVLQVEVQDKVDLLLQVVGRADTEYKLMGFGFLDTP